MQLAWWSQIFLSGHLLEGVSEFDTHAGLVAGGKYCLYLGAVVLNFSFLLTRPRCRLGPGQLVVTQARSGLWVQFHAVVDGGEGGSPRHLPPVVSR